MITQKKFNAFLKYLARLLTVRQMLIVDNLETSVYKKLSTLAKKHSEWVEKYFDSIKLLYLVESHSVPYFLEYNRTNLQPLGVDISSDVFSNIKRQVDPFLTAVLKPIIDKVNSDPQYNDILTDAVLQSYNIGGTKVMITNILSHHIKIRKKDALDEFLEGEDGFASIVQDYTEGFTIRDPLILEALKSRINKIVSATGEGQIIDTKTFERIKDILIQKFYIEGLGVEAVAAELGEVGIPPLRVNVKGKGWRWIDTETRCKMIARTEMNIALNRAIVDAAVKNGMYWKTWDTVGDNRVRPMHEQNELDGEIPFFNNFSTGDFSPDNCASPVNCRCVLSTYSHIDDPPPIGFWDGSDVVRYE